MGALSIVIGAILAVSFVTFVAFFGRLPAFRSEALDCEKVTAFRSANSRLGKRRLVSLVDCYGFMFRISYGERTSPSPAGAVFTVSMAVVIT